jgi:hypothetical protein
MRDSGINVQAKSRGWYKSTERPEFRSRTGRETEKDPGFDRGLTFGGVGEVGIGL